jgi:hypothetical protein
MAGVAIELKKYPVIEEDAEGMVIQRFRYLPLSRLGAYDPSHDPGLELLIYIQTLIEEDGD